MIFNSSGDTAKLYGRIWGGDGQYITSQLSAYSIQAETPQNYMEEYGVEMASTSLVNFLLF